MKQIKLNTGIEMPMIGTGTNTFGKVDGDFFAELNGDTRELLSAIELGYRHIDTAIAYRNESIVGKAIRESGFDRAEFFITSKLPGTDEYTQTDAAVHQGVASSLESFGLDYLDLYLIHHPWDDLEGILRVWRVLEGYVDSGVLKAIGVSNFSQSQLSYLMEHARIKPAVNQIESHPSLWNDALIEACQAMDVVVVGWGPLTRVRKTAKFVLNEIGQKYDKTWAQVILNYQIARGVVVIPKSHNPLRQAQNLDVFDFTLTKEEQSVIAGL